MKYRIEKIYRFEAAHRLVRGYRGKCASNHGHGFRLTLTVGGERLDELGMVADFDELKKFQAWIDEELDHSTLLYREDPFADYLEREGHKVRRLPDNPTSEVIAAHAFAAAERFLAGRAGVTVLTVALDESCTARALVSRQ